MKKLLLALITILMLATTLIQPALSVLASESEPVVSVDNSTPDESQGTIDLDGAKPGIANGTSEKPKPKPS